MSRPPDEPAADPSDRPDENAGESAEPRRIPSTIGGLIYLVLGGVLVVGLATVTFGSWRRGVSLIGIGLIVAAAGRGLLPDRDAGMLGVRSRWFDITVMIGVGALLIALAATIPDQPG